jgi:hypothetical protein
MNVAGITDIIQIKIASTGLKVKGLLSSTSFAVIVHQLCFPESN